MARRVRALSQAEAAYLAGVVDGEGTITLTHIHKGANRQLSVSITNTERQLLDWVRQVIGAGRITTKRRYSERHMPSFTYGITNTQALELLRQIAPYLRTHKRLRAELVLDRYKALTPRNGKYSPELLEQREKFIRTVLAITSKGRLVQQCTGENGAHIGEACSCTVKHDGNAEGSEEGQPQAGPVETHRPAGSHEDRAGTRST